MDTILKKKETRGRINLTGHLVTLAVVSATAIIITLARSVPSGEDGGEPANALRGLAEVLGLEIVSPEPVWVSGGGAEGIRSSAFWGEVVFLAAKGPKKPADLYRAEVKRTPTGGIIAVRCLRNLTDSPAGDDYALVATPPLAAVATRALGQVRSVTLFDFSGRKLPKGGEWSPTARLLAKVGFLLDTGHFGGVDKMNFRFAHPPKHASLSVEKGSGGAEEIVVAWKDRKGEARKEVISGPRVRAEDEELVAAEDVVLPKRPILWLVDTVRSLWWVGPGPIEWAEGRFFAARDAVRRLSYSLTGGSEEVGLAEEPPESEAVREAFTVPPGLEVGEVEQKYEWPPKRIKPPVFTRAAHGEGVWRPTVPDFVRRLENAPEAVYRTFTRPDRERPYVKVHLIAMDMRQFELHMVGGYEDPKPTTGSQGTGRIPRRPEILSNLAIAFNGAFKTEHGAYGMMVERDILLPPQDEAATVASLDDGRAVMGSWPAGMAIPKEMLSLRQNMDPLVEDGVVNPRRRYLWGFTLDEDITNMNTIRSGFCVDESGVLIYAWGEDLTAKTLGVAMNAAGCVYGIHLDMNPYHTSYIFYRFADDADEKRPEFEAELVLKEMMFSPARYVNGAPKDFFFLTLKDPSPGPGWTFEGLAQPAPAFVPAVFKRESHGCELVAVDMTRAKVLISPGEIPSNLAPPGYVAKSGGVDDVLVDVALGPWSSARGQLVDGTVVAALASDRATLGLAANGSLVFGAWPMETPDKSAVRNAVQAGWLGPENSPAEEVAAVGIADGKWLIIGVGRAADLASAMKEVGVSESVAFHAEGEGPQVAIRSETGMVSPAGKKVLERDLKSTSLRVLASPKPLGMARLEEK